MDWNQIYNDNGLRWEKIHSMTTPGGRPYILFLWVKNSGQLFVVKKKKNA